MLKKTDKKFGNKHSSKKTNINWNQVFYFSQIALHGSIKVAAEKLGLTPPTLSEHLMQLERELKVLLFFRQHRRLVLTRHGSKLYQHAKQMFETGQRLIDVVSPVPMGNYPVSVAVAPGFSEREIYALLGEYLIDFGPLNLKFFHAEHAALEGGLLEARYDFVFSHKPSEHKDIQKVLLYASPLRFYVSPKWLNKSLTDAMKNLPLLVYQSELGVLALVEQLLTELDIVPKSMVTSDSTTFLMESCQQGAGIGLFSEYSIANFGGNLKPIRSQSPASKFQERLYLMWTSEAANSEAVLHLKELLQERQSRLQFHAKTA